MQPALPSIDPRQPPQLSLFSRFFFLFLGCGVQTTRRTTSGLNTGASGASAAVLMEAPSSGAEGIARLRPVDAGGATLLQNTNR